MPHNEKIPPADNHVSWEQNVIGAKPLCLSQSSSVSTLCFSHWMLCEGVFMALFRPPWSKEKKRSRFS